MELQERLEAVRDRMRRACERSGRPLAGVRLVAVSKTQPAEAISRVVRLGVTEIGENRVQEAETKKPEVEGAPRWHLVGHLQKNKARKAVELFDYVHSVDSVALAVRLSRLALEVGRILPALVQVDLAGEETKSGLAEEALVPALERMRSAESLRIEGLMILPPYAPDPEDVRPYFRRLRELGEACRARGFFAEDGLELSMGMSHDYEVAIEEGATMIRVGTALFGPRPAPATDARTSGSPAQELTRG